MAMEIEYIEKGIELHEALAAAGMSIWEHDGVWCSNADPALVNDFIRTFNPDTTGKMIDTFVAELEALYDSVAQQRRYDSRYTCALRAGFDGPFKAEGTAFAQWMDTCNAYAYGVMDAVLSGQRAAPTPSELLAELPEMVWP